MCYAIITNRSLASNSVKFFNRFCQMSRQRHVSPIRWRHLSILIKKIFLLKNKLISFFLKKKIKIQKKKATRGGWATPSGRGWPSGHPWILKGWPEGHPHATGGGCAPPPLAGGGQATPCFPFFFFFLKKK
jgi:hypothetical protein